MSTISREDNGPRTLQEMEESCMVEVVSGSRVQLCQMTSTKNLMKIHLVLCEISHKPQKDPKLTSASHIAWQTSMPFPTPWVSHGRWRKTFPLAKWPPSLVFPGTSPITQSVFQTARRRNTSTLFQSGRRNPDTPWTKHKNSMGSYYTHATSFPLVAPTSPAWRPSSGFVTIVLSTHVTHPFELRAIYPGGRRDSHGQLSSDLSLAPSLSSMLMLTQMLAQRLVLGSQSGAGGELGSSSQDGKPMVGTLVGQRWWDSGSSSSLYPRLPPEAPTSKSLGTTEGSSKVGGRAEVVTNPQMKSSSTSMPSLKCRTSISIQDTCPAKKTQQTAPVIANIIMAPSSFPQSSFPKHSDNTYATSMRLSHQLSCALYSKERPQFPCQDPIALPSSGSTQL